MANSKETNNANNPSYYGALAFGILVTMVGVLLRFVANSQLIDIISNIILVAGIFLCLSPVNKILK